MNLRKFKVNQEIIGRVTKTKYLGLNLDEYLSWKDQHKKLKIRLKVASRPFIGLKDILSQSKLAAVYQALIESHLRHGNIIWGCISDSKLDTLHKLQSRAKKLIENGNYKAGWVCDWLPFKKLIKCDRLVMKHKILNGKCPENLQDNFAKRPQISSYSTRSNRDLHLPRPRLEFTKNSFQFKGTFTWNEIPQQHRN